MVIVPTLAAIGSSLWIVYPPSESCAGISLEFARLVDHRDTLTAEVTITTVGAGEVAWSRINLTSAQGRNTMAKLAEATSPEAPWPLVLDQACRAYSSRTCFRLTVALRSGRVELSRVAHRRAALGRPSRWSSVAASVAPGGSQVATDTDTQA